jgi:hypothetical protein
LTFRRRLEVFLIFVFLWGTGAQAELSYSPRVDFHLTNGILQNLGSRGGTSSEVGGLGLVLNYFLGQAVSVGVGYRLSYDFIQYALPLHGFQFPVRYYFSGVGTEVRRDGAGLVVDGRTPMSFYVGSQFASYNYYIGGTSASANVSSGTSSQNLTGSYATFDVLCGGYYRLSRHFDLTFEGGVSALSFAASDSKYRVRFISGLVGVSYVW